MADLSDYREALADAEKEIAALKKAIRDAEGWLLFGEGVGLTYYQFECGDNTDSVAVINSVLSEEQHG